MDEAKIRNSFQKIREDISFLKEEILALREDFSSLLEGLSTLTEKSNSPNTTQNQGFKTDISDFPTHNLSFKPLKPQIRGISNGNEGVPTDRQTNQQTDRHIEKNNKDPLDSALEILHSLDNAKKEIRLKFKRLTDQEFLVFSTIYQLEEESLVVNYKYLSEKLGLTESSVRDYVGKLIKKGIPVEKSKINNKSIVLSISKNFKEAVSLSTILQLKDI